MSGTGTSDPIRKADPESLSLRAKPRRVVRFRRRLLIGIAGAICLAVFGATWLALRGQTLAHPPTQNELYSVDHKPVPEGLSALPTSYGKVKLGAPLPGDLGVAVVEREKSLGLTPGSGAPKPNPEDAASQAQEVQLLQQDRQANEAGVFFRVSSGGSAPANATGGGEGIGGTAAGEQSANTDKLELDPGRDPNAQGRKLEFLSRKVDADVYNPHALQQPVSPYEVLAGTIIPASLITGLDSDLPGLVTAQVTQNIFDSVTGTTLLVPQGSRLLGTYDSVVAFGQSRALVVWQRIVLPDGSSIQIDNLPATDTRGYAGLSDQIDYHTWTLLKGIAMSTLLGVGTQASFGTSQSNLVEAIRQSTQESTNQAGQRIVEKDLDMQPTLKVRPGWRLDVIVHKDLVLRPYQGTQP